MNSVVDFAETLRELLEDKINGQSHSRIDADRLMVKIQALEWVQGRIQDLVINTERKEIQNHK
jgi:hypothetical protein